MLLNFSLFYFNFFIGKEIYFILSITNLCNNNFIFPRQCCIRETAKESSFTNGQAIRREGGRGWAMN